MWVFGDIRGATQWAERWGRSGGCILRSTKYKRLKKIKKYFKKFLLQYITFFVKNLRMSFFFHIFAPDLIQDMCINA